MQRREFCKLAAAAAAATAIPATGQTSDPSQSPVFQSFNTLTQDYAAYCGTPAANRIFYAFRDGAFVTEKLDESHWTPTDYGPPVVKVPELPIPGGSWEGVPMVSPFPELAGDGPFQPTWDSLLHYEVPEWYRDAKFALWAHWSPQCVPEDGDWYARNMYTQGNGQNKYHVQHYGPPSKVGYKDLCAQWTLLNWEPEELITRYKRAGARIFMALANHHDGFDTWNSKHHPWNALNSGPRRDVIGTWAAAARNQGLRFGVSVHQPRNWWWFQTSHGADKTGPLAGVPYDGDLTLANGKGQWWEGLDPQRLYAPKHPPDALPDISYVRNVYDRTRDLIDQHDPDLLYFDNELFPLGWAGMNLGAYFYNRSVQTRGKLDVVTTIKEVPDHLAAAAVVDWENGVHGDIMPFVWQSETCLGNWHYSRRIFDRPGVYGGYQDPRNVIHWLIDTVSKNGTLILNVPGMPDGTIDSKEIAVLDQITAWMQVNGEGIYETRPWKVYGEGPGKLNPAEFQGKSISNLGVQDIRFTRNKANTIVYAFVLGWPQAEFVIGSLGTANNLRPGKIAQVQLLGTGEKIRWRQAADGLHAELPRGYHPDADFAATLKVSLT